MIATSTVPFHVVHPMLWPRRLLMGMIWVYQSTLGPALPPSCRFEPSCSHYAYTAIERHGAFRGTWLTLRRLLRCQPWGGSGYDPVPPASRAEDRLVSRTSGR